MKTRRLDIWLSLFDENTYAHAWCPPCFPFPHEACEVLCNLFSMGSPRSFVYRRPLRAMRMPVAWLCWQRLVLCAQVAQKSALRSTCVQDRCNVM